MSQKHINRETPYFFKGHMSMWGIDRDEKGFFQIFGDPDHYQCSPKRFKYAEEAEANLLIELMEIE